MDIDQARQQHLDKYGSMLYCPERNTLCSFMEGMWGTGCEREGCILDDSDYQRQQRLIETNRMHRELDRRAEKREETKNSPAPIRTQRKTHIDYAWEKIHRLEEQSREAYRRNRPKKGEALLHEAIVMRRKLLKQINK